MTFDEVLAQIIDLLKRQGRVSYGALKRRFDLDDDYLNDLKNEILYVHPVIDDEGRGLIWVGDPASGQAVAPQPAQPTPSPAAQGHQAPQAPEAERRQLTVMFCDLVDSTRLSSQLDPEDLREVVRAYQAACAEVIQRFEGYIAQYLGDGLLVYFGYPQAHEDDAQRAVRTGLGVVEVLGTLNSRLAQRPGVHLAIRVGIHTGLVVVGEIGGGGRQEPLALGETPNIAARLQGLAAPDTLVISEATARLVEGYFLCEALGRQALKGLAAPLHVYRVLHASETQTRLDIAAIRGLTPLVGREAEVSLLRERWTQVQDGLGQVVLLNGEPGIGKSRLVQALKEHLAGERYTRIEYRCAADIQHSAFYPVMAHLERALAFAKDDTSDDKLQKLETALASSALLLPDTVPLVAALLSLPLPAHYPPLTLTPQRQRQHTLEALLAWLVAEATRQPVLFIVEDLHWIDPSTLEFVTLLIERGPTAPILTVLTCRPEFHPPWSLRAHVTLLTLGRLAPPQVAQMMLRVTGDRTLPREIVQHVVTKTDGVPLFVEELTKMVLESGFLHEAQGTYELTAPLPPLAIPTTLHDSLMARLDRLSTVKTVAQLGAAIGRTFAYELLQAVAPLDEAILQHGLQQLVAAELVYQRGRPPQATYMFKHALIQDTAYQSLLRSTRQQYHQRIAQVMEARFPDLCETQPELLAHHYTEAGLTEQAIPYWQRAGAHASDRSANVEAIRHFTTGIELLKTLPETPEHTQHALTLHSALGAALQIAKGIAAPEVEHAYTQARALCQQVGETPQLVPILFGLWRFYAARSQWHTARELGETLLRLAQRTHDPTLAVIAHYALGLAWFCLGALSAAHQHLEEGIARYTPDQRRAPAFRMGQDPGVTCRVYAAGTLWLLGYPDQALARVHEALVLAHELSHAYSLAFARYWVAYVSQFCRDVQAVHEQAAACVTLSTEQGFPYWVTFGTIMRGWALAMQGQGEEGLAQIRQGIATQRATGAALWVPYSYTLLAEVSDHLGRTEEGLQALAEAHTMVEQYEDRWWEAEIHRLRGIVLLRQPGTPQTEVETWLQRALDVARRQEAKSLELRAAMSLARLWQQQGKSAEAHALLAPIYGWFTEGFDTADLQEAKALLAELQ
jgi:class 3 adenylate cyclase/predicted ATPase